MKQHLTRTEAVQVSMIIGMIAYTGIPLAITLVTAIIELLRLL